MKRTVMAVLLATTLLAHSFAQVKNGFREENDVYYATAEGTGTSESESVNRAKYAALDVIFDHLQKDRLFRDMFFKNPPLSIAFTDLKSEKQLSGGFKTKITVKLDGEAIRMMYSGPYLQSVNNLLDKAESDIEEIEKALKQASDSEKSRKIALAETGYWQIKDKAEVVAGYLSPVEDTVIMSTKGRRKSPEIKAAVTGYRKMAEEGIARIKSAEKELVDDEELKNFNELLEAIEKENEKAETLIAKTEKIAGNPERQTKKTLETTRSELSIELKALEQSKVSLDRNAGKLPPGKDYLKSSIDIAYHRLSKNSGTLTAALQSVEQEIFDPAIVRAERDAFFKWFLFHEPGDNFAVRWAPPFGLETSPTTKFIGTGRFDISVRAEGAFPLGSGGVWARTEFKKLDSITTGSLDGDILKNTGYQQDAALGFYGPLLFGAGVSWDWMRDIGGKETAKGGGVRAIFGGMDPKMDKAAWMLSLQYNLPPADASFDLGRDILNLTLEGLLRLGSFAVVEGHVGKRVIRSSATSLDNLFSFSVGAGIRLPAPFLWGIEYTGMTAELLTPGNFATGTKESGNYFRVFVEYTL